VNVEEETEIAREVLDERQHSGLAGRLAGASSQIVFYDPSQVGEKTCKELRAPGEESWERLGEGGDVLPQLLTGKHTLDEPNGGRRYPSPPTPRTEHPRLAGGPNDAIDAATVTAEPDKALVGVAEG
jgi:hypothetical protein